MANEEHLAILRQGVKAWNQWRKENSEVTPDLSGADLGWANLSEVNFNGVNLRQADFREANLFKADLGGVDFIEANLFRANLIEADLTLATLNEADLKEANLSGADLSYAIILSADLREANLREANLNQAELWRTELLSTHLNHANLSGAHLREANLGWADLCDADLTEADLFRTDFRWANLSRANLSGADISEANLGGANFSETDLSKANLAGATLLQTNFTKANLTNCCIYGVSAWDLNLTDAIQKDLVITPEDQSVITVDNLEVGQFVYLLLNNEKIRDVIDTITSKAVLILGRFTPERKAILDRLRDELRERDYVPILFDFDKPTNEDFTGTIKTLAGMCHFVIADITNPKSSPLELQATVPDYMIPFVPIIQEAEEPFAMFVDLWIRHRDWVLEPLKYVAAEDLIAVLEEAIIQPAEQRYAELTLRKAQALMTRHTSQYRSNA